MSKTDDPIIKALTPFLKEDVSAVFKTRDYGKYGKSDSVVLIRGDDMVEISAVSEYSDATLGVSTDPTQINSAEGEVNYYDGPIEKDRTYVSETFGDITIVSKAVSGKYSVERLGDLMIMSEEDLRREIIA